MKRKAAQQIDETYESGRRKRTKKNMKIISDSSESEEVSERGRAEEEDEEEEYVVTRRTSKRITNKKAAKRAPVSDEEEEQDEEEQAEDEDDQQEQDQEMEEEEDAQEGEGQQKERGNAEEDEIGVEEEADQADYLNDETDNNEDFCFICRENGQLICCENCYRSFHMECLDLKKTPMGVWECYCCKQENKKTCNYCSKTVEQSTAEEEKPVTEKAIVYQCSLCYSCMHEECVALPINFALDCPLNRQFVLDTALCEKISHFRRTESTCTEQARQDLDAQLRAHVHGRTSGNALHICALCITYFGVERIVDHAYLPDGTLALVLSFDGASELHNCWVREEQIEKVAPRKLKNYKERNIVTHSNEKEGGSSKRGGGTSARDDGEVANDEGDLQEELEEMTRIERIVDCKRPLKHCRRPYREALEIIFAGTQNGTEQQQQQSVESYQKNIRYGAKDNHRFFVKWRGQNYDRCTWEDEFVILRCREQLRDFLRLKVQEESLGQSLAKFREERQIQKRTTRTISEAALKNGQPEYITGGDLHGFQIQGWRWLRDSYIRNNNVILADEMGLGKTIQTISFLNFLFYEKQIDGPFLVVVPATTMYNWMREFQTWGDKMNVIVYMGNPESREIMREREFYFKDLSKRGGAKNKSRVPKFNVVITSYDTAINDIYTLKRIYWECLVVDEAHRLKNNESKFFKTSQMIRTKHKVLLTGTPLQNNIIELLNLIEFITPAKAKSLKSYDSLKVFMQNNPGMTLGKEGKEGSQSSVPQLTEEERKRQLQELTEALQPHLLRRKKQDVDLQLPEMEEIIVKTALTDRQKYYYKNVLVRNYESLKIFDAKSKQMSKFSLLNILMSLRLICNHPHLFLYKKKFPVPSRDQFREEFIDTSNKLKFMERIIPKLIAQEHKMLIFSQFTMMLDILGEFMLFHGIQYERLDGSTTVVDRQKIIDSFNAKDSKIYVFLLSTRAGGLGINLTSADTIFFTDSDFNPYRDVQAISRAHRMGQRQKVKVYRLVSKYSAEERIIEIATRKLLLESIVINPINKFTKDDFESIFKNGTYEMFNKNLEEKDQEFTEAQIDALISREGGVALNDQNIENVSLRKNNDLNDYYLSGFKFTSMNFETVRQSKDDIVQNQVEEKKYWETLLDDEALKLRQDQYAQTGRGQRKKNLLAPNLLDEDPNKAHLNDDGSNFSDEISKGDDKKSSTDINGREISQHAVGDVARSGDRKEKQESKREKKERERLQRQQQQDRERQERERDFLEKQQKIRRTEERMTQFFHDEVLLKSKAKTTEGPNHIAQRITALSLLKKRLSQFHKKPEKFRIMHKDYQRPMIETLGSNLQGGSSDKWTNYDDFLLIYLLFAHGYGNWDKVMDDPRFWSQYSQQQQPQSQQVANIESWKILFKKLDKKADRDISTLDVEKARAWVMGRLQMHANNLSNWLIEIDQSRKEFEF